MDKYVDKSLGGLKYTLTIMRGRNRQVTEVIHHVNDEERTIDGDFILTIGGKAVILTRNREPVIVKRWKPQSIENYMDQSKITVFTLSGVKITEVYQDSDGWIWEGIVDEDGNHFNVISDGEYLFTISF
jgi:hypothetical protein